MAGEALASPGKGMNNWAGGNRKQVSDHEQVGRAYLLDREPVCVCRLGHTNLSALYLCSSKNFL